MVVVGCSWVLYWLLVDTFNLDSLKAALVTGVVFIIAGLLVEGLPTFKRP